MSDVGSSGARRARVVAIAALMSLSLSGCGWRGLNSLPLPGAEGTGDGSYQIHIQMPNVTTLTENSPVMIDDVTVGSVTDIEVEGWHALVTVGLNPGVRVPANAVARIGQTSLLGSTHVQLAAPTGQRPTGEMQTDDTIPLARAGVYPTTEETLSALSMVVNGGGVGAIADITREVELALHGRAGSARGLIDQLTLLTTGLNAQRGDIDAALVGLDRLTVDFAAQKDTITSALEAIPPALAVLVSQRQNLTEALKALGGLSDVASQIIRADGANFQATLRNLAPVLTQLANTGSSITHVLPLLATFPFTMRNLDKFVKGDFVNLYETFDLTASRLDTNFFTGTPLGGMWGGVDAKRKKPNPAASPAAQAVDPFRGPLALLPQLLPPPPAPAPKGGR